MEIIWSIALPRTIIVLLHKLKGLAQQVPRCVRRAQHLCRMYWRCLQQEPFYVARTSRAERFHISIRMLEGGIESSQRRGGHLVSRSTGPNTGRGARLLWRHFSLTFYDSFFDVICDGDNTLTTFTIHVVEMKPAQVLT